MRDLIEKRGLSDRITVDSSGTSDEELGNPVDPRAVKEAARRGLTLEHTAGQFRPSDFDKYDLVLVADRMNMRRMERLARDEYDRAKLRFLREFDAMAGDVDIADPWYGGPDGFTTVYDQMETACRGLLDELVSQV